jgi:N-acyl homoserine lactone hydrolase
MTAEHDIRNQLAKLGLRPSDIRYVVNSHFHYDHTGGNRFFTESKILVQKAEYRFALYPDSFVSGVYLKHQYDHPLQYELLEGDTEVVDGVHIFTSYGHSPGHQSLVVKLPKSGTAVLVGDAMYCRENYATNIPPGNAWNMPLMFDSMKKLAHLAKICEGKLYITHDPSFWDEHQPAPFYYE